jgi:hypothetical protein
MAARLFMQEHWSAERTIISILIMLALFLSGMTAGRELALFNAPNSFVAEAAGFVAPPLSFILGMIAWQSLTMISLLIRLIGRVLKRSKDQPIVDSIRQGSPEEAIRELRNKAWVMVAVHLMIFCPVGAIVGLAVGINALPSALLQFGLLGLLYGGAMYGLAKADLLPLADEL